MVVRGDRRRTTRRAGDRGADGLAVNRGDILALLLALLLAMLALFALAFLALFVGSWF